MNRKNGKQLDGRGMMCFVAPLLPAAQTLVCRDTLILGKIFSNVCAVLQETLVLNHFVL